jgi:hypothetical protein
MSKEKVKLRFFWSMCLREESNITSRTGHDHLKNVITEKEKTESAKDVGKT